VIAIRGETITISGETITLDFVADGINLMVSPSLWHDLLLLHIGELSRSPAS